MLRSLYHRVLRLAASPRAELWLAMVSCAESSFFPVPPDALLIPMVIARPTRAWRIALICTIASVGGGALGYLIGYALYDQVAAPLVRLYHLESAKDQFIAGFNRYGLWIILLKGLTPIPYKLVTITSGLAHYDFVAFMAASALTRGARFFLWAAVLQRYGEPIRAVIERRLALITWASLALIVAVVVALEFA